ncbi:tRNA (adenosine(37)-N6)-threonylcarbamoyltransferase complex ATPase subunit type 1 TsaE [Brachyspira hyodysenteriae]|uniref:tRNA (adenosine(37)-N6)-threonylcarbamoyltransferase complex ATPase subunit type 1 TsaE n=1 Tax=Brachyspira hyodysenteriae TaxID=159 RepID=UPI00063DBD4F|nr:tRNA (adenosine(37)-N6)-threonylcarbamoyltransferase complex ATPase subunit type 1 TsaE [Brachyspira hyodysenteriae]KLI15432.1 nucleotide-binding protein [Brachyspira hyodysenteriae]KLI35967.1 nucleotide-binding protein [Brachyspira hyodysenteriae]KLI53149.1 nucleotide-binding protein [Brachyspira hyodysenteriae]MCZ9980036.1 tRNA (adenosine(37)-N6)-threonylcarbamoyltransferase complex ATPase subunit type 1 TsaE [Brachyspira hyodysenteriae]QTM04748.1 tRNA (adenosine(37)-N6)-threonylcarbamoyl
MKKEIIKEEKNISLDDIEKVAEFFKDILKDGDVVIMEGNLGFGKTTFVRILSRLMESEDIVSSPSFTLINEYDIILNGEESILRHVDLYRLEKEDELDDIGFKDKIRENGITMIEWGNKFKDYFEAPYYLFEIEMYEENNRLYRISLIS